MENNQEKSSNGAINQIDSSSTLTGSTTIKDRGADEAAAGGAQELPGLSVKDNVDKSKMRMEFEAFMAEMSKMSKEDTKFTRDYQMERLMSRQYANPHDVLEVGPEASEVEIKRKFRMLSMLVHPDKNKHEKAGDAFGMLDKAYKTLMDVEKRRTYQRVMREAKERVELQRKKDNEKRLAQGQQPLPQDTLHVEV